MLASTPLVCLTKVVASVWVVLLSATAATGSSFRGPASGHLADGVVSLAGQSTSNGGPTTMCAAVRGDWSLHPKAAGALLSSSVAPVPVVMAHGMGDSCFNPGMDSITKAVGARVGSYSVCIGDGDDQV
jgi:hypothetical protein